MFMERSDKKSNSWLAFVSLIVCVFTLLFFLVTGGFIAVMTTDDMAIMIRFMAFRVIFASISFGFSFLMTARLFSKQYRVSVFDWVFAIVSTCLSLSFFWSILVSFIIVTFPHPD